LLWAAGVLGFLAIVIAVLLVVQYREKQDKNRQPAPETTVTQSAPATPQNWTPTPRVGKAGTNIGSSPNEPLFLWPPTHDEHDEN
jgi:hypothetical protein